MQIVPVPTGCPKCGGKLWDNRATKKTPKMPDFKCRDKACDTPIWPLKDGNVWADSAVGSAPIARPAATAAPVSYGQHIPAIDGPSVGGVASQPHSGMDTVLTEYLGAIADAAGPVTQVLVTHGFHPTAADVLAAAATLHISRSRR